MYIIKQNKNNEWILIKKGAARATRIFSTRIEAEMYAKEKYPNNYEVEESVRPVGSTKKGQKKVENNIKKAAKKHPKAIFVLLVIVLLIIIGVGAYLYFSGKLDSFFNKNEEEDNNVIVDDTEVKLYSIEMHDKYGDSLFIKYGSYDILIDAGDAGDGEYVRDFVDSHISSDKNLDLLIVTHCHSDHMGGLTKMSSSDKKPKALDNVSSVSNIIDFGHSRSNNTMYETYSVLRKSFIDKGTKYYSAYEAVNGIGGLTNIISFGALSVEIIDTNYYKKIDEDVTGSEPYNEYSVAALITYNNTKLFCAGDLEDRGEANLIANANNTSLKDIKDSDTVIYKMCHHGTDVGSANNFNSGKTSTNGGNRIELLKIIKPDYVFVSSAIGESPHPYVRAVATMLYFTENLYFNGTNGTLEISINGNEVEVHGLGATTDYKVNGKSIDYETQKDLKYQETLWYNQVEFFETSRSWYSGDKANPTIKEITEWYLGELKRIYG